jgi:hypothetical protein
MKRNLLQLECRKQTGVREIGSSGVWGSGFGGSQVALGEFRPFAEKSRLDVPSQAKKRLRNQKLSVALPLPEGRPNVDPLTG